jgi:hypothetical protein
MITKTFGSDEGIDAVHEAMMKYLTVPVQVAGGSHMARTVYHTSWNLSDMTMLLNALEYIMESVPDYRHEAVAAGNQQGAYQAQQMIDWAEQMYRDIAGIVGVELI